MLIDSHCHLNYPGLVEDQAGVLARGRAAGLQGFVNISTKRSEWQAVVAAAEREAGVWATIGVHPHNAEQHRDVSAQTLVDAAALPHVIGLGETGLDYHYTLSPRQDQIRLFKSHIEAARVLDVPVVIHTRDAEDDTLAILREEQEQGDFRALIHCFTGSAEFARSALDLGLFISFSGIVTFKNAKALQSVAAEIPHDRLLLETDSPSLAPVPYRGRTCEPAYIRETCAFVAGLRSIEPEELAAETSANFFKLFSKARL